MTDVKWSNDSEFLPKSEVTAGDRIMGLSSSNENIKILASVLVSGDVTGPSSSTQNAISRYDGTTGKIIKNSLITIDDQGDLNTPSSISCQNITVSEIANLPNNTSNQSNVSTNGNDETGDGSFWRPYLTVEYADNAETDLVYIQAGDFLESAIATKTEAWKGQGKDLSIVNSGLLTIDDDSWSTGLTPSRMMSDLAVINTNSGGVIEVDLTSGGSGYTSAPTITFTGGGGTGATATATIGSSIQSVTVTAPGSYAVIPTVSATIGTGATFSTTMTAQSVSIVDKGSNYTAGQEIIVESGTAVNSNYAIVTVSAVDDNGSVTSATVSSGGEYSVLPGNPISDSDAYTAVTCATTSPLTFFTYTDGPDASNPGVGAKIANNGIAAQFQADGVIPAVGQRVLNWTMGDTRLNGIYTMTVNDASTGNWEMVRSTDFDQPIEITKFNRLSVTSGTKYGGTRFYVTTSRPVQIGTAGSAINFGQAYGETFSFNIYNWGLSNISVTNSGTGYTNASILEITGGGAGNGKITLNSSGVVTGVTVTDPGSAYSSAPTVVFTSSSGSGAAATAVISPASGSMNFSPTTYRVGSSYLFRSFSFPHNATFVNATNLKITGDCDGEDLEIENIVDTYIDSPLEGGLLVTSSDNSSVTAMNLVLNSLLIETLIVNNSTGIPITFTITNCHNLATIIGDDGGTTSLIIDEISFPKNMEITPASIVYLPTKITPIVVTSSLVIALNNTYIANGTNQIVFTLPTAATPGDKFKIIGQGAGGFQIAQNSSPSDQIMFVDKSTTAGTAGSITTYNRYQTIEVYNLAVGIWSVTFASGDNWNVV